ncbi:MAG: hypothetical protein EPN70_03120 [Paraburkholderia sp.]|uniref:hypothetical protein n=1 Tax=Paraburkholderia sp. TaxID=1926495 RepID=UPI001213CB84|nr:hypothetical protein [Paraburkholderia sp.]TAM07330.1 MAG: hypothetical protein EPN70_03120 [Paraburkholderia sp.]TAM29220.1 MAG: hypothetical protein EPN59_13205 [Paraburkholderia sp.]
MSAVNKHRGFPRNSTHTTRAYTLQPVRSRLARWSVALVWTIAAATAGAGAAVWALGQAAPEDRPGASPDALHAELADMQLKLEQAHAVSAALQESADSAQADIAKLRADLMFLRSHSRAAR